MPQGEKRESTACAWARMLPFLLVVHTSRGRLKGHGNRLPTASPSAAGARRGAPPRLSGGRRADPLPPRLPPHRRPHPDPRQRPRAGRHAPDRPQDPRHLRPLQHHSRTGTPRGRGSAGRLSGAARTGDATWPQSWIQRENWEFETHRVLNELVAVHGGPADGQRATSEVKEAELLRADAVVSRTRRASPSGSTSSESHADHSHTGSEVVRSARTRLNRASYSRWKV